MGENLQKIKYENKIKRKTYTKKRNIKDKAGTSWEKYEQRETDAHI